ncbi:MAG TPA: hypothetical protein VLN57_19655 [Xanthobacteraceae bacterium]|jgi:hypothetical protein|nr:hypothetical protein [Xanthobacteraceae bacterium]
MEQSQNTVPAQALADELRDGATTHSATETQADPAAVAGQPTPIAIDAPGLAPVDAQPGSPEPVTIDLNPRRAGALTRWIVPTAQKPRVDEFAPGADRMRRARASRWHPPRVSRLAALIALAIGGGAIAGTLGTAWVMRTPVSDQSVAVSDYNQIKGAIERLNADLVTLRANVEGTGRAASTQVARLTDRVDRVERAQSEPAAKIAKMNEALERIDRRTRDIPDLGPALPEQRVPPPTPIKEITRMSVVPGWVVRSVYDGAALIQGRIGMIEVEVGDPLPGGGRVEAIRRQDGHWVVVTSKGLILAAQ